MHVSLAPCGVGDYYDYNYYKHATIVIVINSVSVVVVAVSYFSTTCSNSDHCFYSPSRVESRRTANRFDKSNPLVVW